MKRYTHITPEVVSLMYLSGDTIECIARTLSVTTSVVCSRLKEAGVKSRTAAEQRGVTQEDEGQIAKMYSRGDSIKSITAKTGAGKEMIWRIAIGHGCRIRETGGQPEYTLDLESFQKPSPARSYWLGFLMADGSLLDSERSMAFRVLVGDVDAEHVQKFADFIKCTNPVRRCEISAEKSRTGKCKIAKLEIYNQEFCKSLISLGCEPRKTYTAKAIPVFENDRDFWRGYIDGDGSLFFSGGGNRPMVSCISHPGSSLVSQFSTFCKSVGASSTRRTANNGSSDSMIVTGANAILVARSLYSGSPKECRLERKHLKYLEMEKLLQEKADNCKHPCIMKSYGRLFSADQMASALESLKSYKTPMARRKAGLI